MADYGWEPVEIPEYTPPAAPAAPPPPEKDWKYYLQQFGPILAGGAAMMGSSNPYAAGLAYGATQTALSALTDDPYKQQQQIAQGSTAMFGSYPYYQHYQKKNPSLPSAPGQKSGWSKWWDSWNEVPVGTAAHASPYPSPTGVNPTHVGSPMV